MGYNHDGKYDHFTSKTFTSKNIPDKCTSEEGKEASPPGKPVDWDGITGLQKPWEAKYDEETYTGRGEAKAPKEPKERKGD